MSKKNPLLDRDGPQEGIWYLVYLKPRWELMMDNTGLAHIDLWQKEIALVIIKHYKIKTVQDKKDVRMLHVSMPRGRVSGPFEYDKYVVGHGEDWPPKSYPDGKIKQIIGSLGLSKLAGIGKVDIEFDVHQTMDIDEQERIQEIIGEVPYA